MGEKTLVTIVTTTYNSEKYIKDCINSVKNQKYKDIEHIIIDGLSSDGTSSILMNYKQDAAYSVKLVFEEDEGIYDAMNKGIKKANGTIIGILNSDDYYEPDTINNVVNSIKGFDILHGNIRFVNEEGQTIKVYGHKKGLIRKYISTPYNHPTMFVKKEVYETLGMFNSSYKVAGDYDFILRLERSKFKDLYVDKILTNFRTVGLTSSTDDVVAETEIKKALMDNGVASILAVGFVKYRLIRSKVNSVFKKNRFLREAYRKISPYHKNI